MAIIYSYPEKTTPAGGDFLVITDSEQPAPNKNRTKSLTIDNLANYVVTSTSSITGSGTLNTIAMFTPDGQSLGDSQLLQEVSSNGLYKITFNNANTFVINKPSSVTSFDPDFMIRQDNVPKVSMGWDDDGAGFGFLYNWAGDGWRFGSQGNNPELTIVTTAGNEGVTITNNLSVNGALTVEGISTFNGDATFENAVNINDALYDQNSSSGTAGQVLSSTGTNNVEWKSYSDSGATFLGWARYDGTPSFSNGTEVTVTDGNFIDPPVSLVTNQIIDPYVNGASGKFVFTNDDLNAVYSLTAVFKASAANANQTHVEVDFVSGATDYERLSKSIAFYKGNDQIDNFHEMFQFYVDSDLITYGLQPRLYAQGGDVKFGDVIFFIQKQQQPAI